MHKHPEQRPTTSAFLQASLSEMRRSNPANLSAVCANGRGFWFWDLPLTSDCLRCTQNRNTARASILRLGPYGVRAWNRNGTPNAVELPYQRARKNVVPTTERLCSN
jgi:hypothetical protein